MEAGSTVADSVVRVGEDRRVIVELDPDHPGFRDSAYRDRRNAIAQIALDHEPRSPVPSAPYTAEEHEVWQRVCDEVASVHERFAFSEYLTHWRELRLPRDRIPQLEEVSALVQPRTGFRLEPVAGLVNTRTFLSALADKIFLSTQYIRHYSVPDYTPEPDVVHELIGHAAQLANPRFAALSMLFGRAAQACGSDEEVEVLGRIYWFTIEFGLVREAGRLKAYGAGLLSSFGELSAIETVESRPLDVEEIERHAFDVTRFQDVLYCADSIDKLEADLIGYLEGKIAS